MAAIWSKKQDPVENIKLVTSLGLAKHCTVSSPSVRADPLVLEREMRH